MELSAAGAQFVRIHEGVVTKAYLDSGGVWTIGIGFTSLSKSFGDYWQKKKGRRNIKKDDTMTVVECDALLPQMFAEEYMPPIQRRFGNMLKQHQVDCCGSIVWNCGAGTLKDKWANSLAAGA